MDDPFFEPELPIEELRGILKVLFKDLQHELHPPVQNTPDSPYILLAQRQEYTIEVQWTALGHFRVRGTTQGPTLCAVSDPWFSESLMGAAFYCMELLHPNTEESSETPLVQP